MSILKPLAKGAVAGIAVVVTGLVGASYASAQPLPIDPNGQIGSVITDDAAAQLTAELEAQLQAELSEQMSAEEATELAKAVATKLSDPIEDAVSDQGTLDAASLADLQDTLTGILEDTLGVEVDLSLDLDLGLDLDLLGDLDVQGLLDSLLGGLLGGDLPVGGLTGGQLG
jgi:hypothetical protein